MTFRAYSLTNASCFIIFLQKERKESVDSCKLQEGFRNRSSSKMTKYVECWGADKPFANITESTLAKNIGLTVSIVVQELQY